MATMASVRRRRLEFVALALVLSAAVPARADVGRPLAEALQELRARGLALVYTSELVRPEMRAGPGGDDPDPRRALDRLLAPHGLDVREAPGGLLVVVARRAAGAGPEAAPSGLIAGTVSVRGGAGALAGARVRVVESGFAVATEADGAFALTDLPPGDWTLAVSADGCLDERIAVALAPGGFRRVDVELLPRPFFTDEIMVQPSRTSLLAERPESSLALGREEIESLPHLGGDVFRALSLLPGTAANDVTAQVSVRGGRRDEVLIELDGQELFDAHHLEDYDGALSIVPASNLSSATLSTGSFPASRGDRMGGLLDLTTLAPAAASRLRLGLSALDVAASAAGARGERGGWLLSGRRGALDLAARAIGSEHPAFWDAFAKVEAPLGAGSFAARLLAAGDALDAAKRDETSFENIANGSRSRTAWLSHQASLGDRLVVESSVSWANLERRRRGSTSEEDGRFDLRDRRDLDVLGLGQSYGLAPVRGHELEFGFAARRYDAAFDTEKDLELGFPVIAPFAAPRATRYAIRATLAGDHLGVWTSDRLALGRLTAVAGLRYDRHTGSDDTLLSPRLLLARRLGERGVLRVSWGRFHQSQRPYELEVEDGVRTLARAERAEHALVGLEWALARLGLEAVRVELYDRAIAKPRPRFENLLESLNVFQEVEPDRVRIAPERSRARGVEATLRGRRGARLDWWLAYSYSRSEDRLAGRWIPRPLDQPHAATLDVALRLPRDWNLNLALRVHSGWPTTPVAGVRIADPDDPDEGDGEFGAKFGAPYSRRLPTYHRLDLRASRARPLRRGRLTFFVDIQNLYDRENLAGFDLQVDTEAETLRAVREHWPGIFPSIGLSWEL